MGLSVSEPSIQCDQFPHTQLGGNDTSHPSITWIRSALNQPCGLKIVEKVGHDGSVDAQMLGQGQLASDVRASRSG